MTEAQDVVAPLTRAAKSWREIKFLVESAYGDKNVSYSLINTLIEAAKDVKLTKTMKRPGDILVAVAVTV
jgi:hypothetical protein